MNRIFVEKKTEFNAEARHLPLANGKMDGPGWTA